MVLGVPLIRLDQVDSTNSYAGRLIKSGDALEGTVILAEFQTLGRGQKGSTWESRKGLNLTFSFILMPAFLEVNRHFYLLMSISMGILDLLRQEGIKAQIKWPNDLVAAGRKIGGILIENSMKGNCLSSSVVGIGINVNQTRFAFKGGDPTSMKLELGRSLNREDLFGGTLKHLTAWINRLYAKEWRMIRESYLQHLFQFDQWADYKDDAGDFRGRITGVLEGGELSVEKLHGRIHHYGFKEIAYKV
jgi:BirA family transcriptional regulator, biotin operon repressor / biotin---[acetyl-CoA-carboxylase] ligase